MITDTLGQPPRVQLFVERQMVPEIAAQRRVALDVHAGLRGVPHSISSTRERYSAAGQFIGGERAQHVELVALRIGHDHPADLALGLLADAGPTGAERLKPGDLGGLILRPQIQVQPGRREPPGRMV
jgi:hypothetical protein